MTKENSHFKFNGKFIRDFWQLAKPYWSSEEKWSARLFLALNILCTIISVRASVALNTFNKDFYNALQDFNKPAITIALTHCAVIILVLVLSYGYAFYFNRLLSIRWHRWLTNNILNRWLSNYNYYHQQLQHKLIDNPDQRISEDLEIFPATTLTVTILLLDALLTLASFGYILWGLSSYLLLGAFVYGAIGTWITAWLGKRLAKLDYDKQRANANFRFSLVRLRDSSEQIAMSRGEATEHKKFQALFTHIFDNFINITNVKKRLTFFTSGYATAAYLVGVMMAIPLYLQKKVQLGGMMQISGAFSSVIRAFSMLVDGFSLFAEWRAVVHRLTEFNKSIDILSETKSNIKMSEHDDKNIVINNLKIFLPDDTSLLNEINLTFRLGNTYLLTGPSGSGKSIFLRALAGIWPHATGEITTPENIKTVFLSQKPYFPLGSLKDALCYPESENIDDAAIYSSLLYCGLERFSHRLHDVKLWTNELSLGEQQLIALTRVFIHKPEMIFLDESTSALDEKTEAMIYDNLKKYIPNITIISVGHRNTLWQHHDTIINLTGAFIDNPLRKIA